MKRFISSLTLAMMTILLMSTVLPIGAYSDAEFEKDPNYYRKVCSTAYDENEAMCDAYRAWLRNNIDSSNKELADVQGKIKANKLSINEQSALLTQYNESIENAANEIADLEGRIFEQEIQIKGLENKIQERLLRIEEREKLVKSYMAAMQSTMRVNNYIEYVMGAEDFSDMMRRTEGTNAIREYNGKVISELALEKENLKKDQDTLVASKDLLELDRQATVAKKEETEILQASVAVLISSLRSQLADLVAYSDMVENKIALNQGMMNSIDGIIATSGFGRIVGGSYSWGEGVWYYSGGGPRHFGQDFPSPRYTSLLAPGNGIVASTRGGCPTVGSYPGNCNGGWGNYVTTIINVNGNIYGTLMAHMAAGSIAVSAGDIIFQGQQIGQVGSSGSSTGNHVHLEIYYLGNDSIADAYDRWQGGVTFETGGTSWGGGWEKRCVANGHRPPCRENPANFY